MNRTGFIILLALSVSLTTYSERSTSSISSDSQGTVFQCPEDKRYYFCDDFENGNYTGKWRNLISTYGLPSPGKFDILDEGRAGKSLRFTASTRGSKLHEGELLLVNPKEFANVPADYFVEYRVRPRANGNSGNKYLYAMLRYQNPLNWYYGGLNLHSSPAATMIESGLTRSESVAHELQQVLPIELGRRNETDGIWYTVRTEVTGSTLTTWLDGEQIDQWTDDAKTYPNAGLIGFFTYNRSFELDYVKVGDPAIKPVQLNLDYKKIRWRAEVGSEKLVIRVNDGHAEKTLTDSATLEKGFSVISNKPAVVAVLKNGNEVILNPTAPGKAEVILTAHADTSVQRLIKVQIDPAWIMPVATYGTLENRASPAPLAKNEYVDTTFSLTFDNTPSLKENSTAEVRIFNAEDDSIVDRIAVAGETDELGYLGQDQVRAIKRDLIWVQGNVLHIKPHNHALKYGQEYYLAIGDGVIAEGAQLNGQNFVGLGKTAAWRISTKATAPDSEKTRLTVAKKGEADFRSVQGALDWTMKNFATDTAVTINIKNGTYNELLFLRNKNNLSIVGEDRNKTLIQTENYSGLNDGSGQSSQAGGHPAGGRSLFLVEEADLLSLQNLTIKNLHQRNGNGDQAETVKFNSDQRFIAREVNFISEQDTLLMRGYNWFYNCLVAGNVDFIWGYSAATVFENSEIRSLGDSKSNEATSSGGYVLQARIPKQTDPGFVFLNSTFTQGPSDSGVTIRKGSSYLARSAGQSGAYDNITFINTKMDTHIADIGWAYSGINKQPAPTPAKATADSGWREYGSMDLAGKPLDLSNRCSNNGSCYLLKSSEVRNRFCNRAQIFAGYNNNAGWDPYPQDPRDDNCDSPDALSLR